MALVVNVLHFKEAVDPALFERAVTDLEAPMAAIPGFESVEVVRSGDTQVVLLIAADTVETLDRIATDVGSPWMVEHVVPLLAGPPERHIGPIIASTRTR